MANICPACNEDMTERDKFTTGCCGQTCCGPCRLETQTLANDEQYRGCYDIWDGTCAKGTLCTQIEWVCYVIYKSQHEKERRRREMLEREHYSHKLAEARAYETPEQRFQRASDEHAERLAYMDMAIDKEERADPSKECWDWATITSLLPPINMASTFLTK